MTHLHPKYHITNSKKSNPNNGEGTSSNPNTGNNSITHPIQPFLQSYPQSTINNTFPSPFWGWQSVPSSSSSQSMQSMLSEPQPMEYNQQMHSVPSMLPVHQQPVQFCQPAQSSQTTKHSRTIKTSNVDTVLHKTKSANSLRITKSSSSSMRRTRSISSPYISSLFGEDLQAAAAEEKKYTRNNLPIRFKREIIFITDICKIKFEKISRMYGIARNTINGYIKKHQLRSAGQKYLGKSRLKGFPLINESLVRDGKSKACKVLGDILLVKDYQFTSDSEFENYRQEFTSYIERVADAMEISKSRETPVHPPEMFLSFTMAKHIHIMGGLGEIISCDIVSTHRARIAHDLSDECYVSGLVMTNRDGTLRRSEMVQVQSLVIPSVQGQDILYNQGSPLTFHKMLLAMDTPGRTKTFLIDEQVLCALTASEEGRIPQLKNTFVLAVPTGLRTAMPTNEFTEMVRQTIQKGYATDPGTQVGRLCGHMIISQEFITKGFERFASEIFLDAYQNRTPATEV